MNFLREALERLPSDTFFVQIGVMDSVSLDPIHKCVRQNGWAGVAVEPLPHLYAELVETYRQHPEVLCVNAAVDITPGERNLYYIPSGTVLREWLPDYLDGCASFYLDRNALRDYPQFIEKAVVQCVTLPGLLEQHQVKAIDLFQVDAEGYDLVILWQLDFSRYHPQVIIYEASSLTKQELLEAGEMLECEGYAQCRHLANVVAWRADTP